MNIKKKKSRIVAGIMSGTSLDGIDCAIVHIKRKGRGITWNLLSHAHKNFREDMKRDLDKVIRQSDGGPGLLNDLNQALTYLYAEAVRHAARKARLPLTDIDLIGCHGQTVYHRPKREKRYGKRFGATLQIGDASTLSVITGIPVVGNFRSADVALGGEGAPLVPYAEYLMFTSPRISRLLINLGGIANITYLPKKGTPEKVVAFDTGPANMVIDLLMQKFFNKDYDRSGIYAGRGKVLDSLFMELITHPFIHRKPPKSTGREDFGESFIQKLKQKLPRKYDPHDIIATMSEFTAWSIFYSYTTYVSAHSFPDEVIVSGGGAKNRYIVQALRDYFDGVTVIASRKLGMPAEAKEAACFAVLANQTADGYAGNLPSVTGASGRTTLGIIAYPHNANRRKK